ncbi:MULTISPECIES: precorrin-2 C(20)-methyltransferase [unclassified Paludibacterium]|uniref:precorrin-2 C(20)-methyltransferase n=1 Tax=unclassified Paludibacterium TaxID=2618429 RepID=UPI001C03AA6F|nr:precorrin-2 C(20)-methyltransferase [Paludibacterium sp. B53371]BEV70983.1 precorrin-2 C(20)-methyltransferase [Paludibacterium sp. THUN1379]
MSQKPGRFIGIGVGPGTPGLMAVAALNDLRQADIIILPRARSSDISIARQCLAGLDIDPSRFREIEFNMDPDRSVLARHYGELAQTVAEDLRRGLTVAYLTIGDAMTYSTYGYLLAAVRDLLPQAEYRTWPGITSFAATASALSWPLGEGKERMLILPCPDDMAALQADIESHDIVILMKIGKRLHDVLALLTRMGIAEHCAYARRIGLADEVLCERVDQLDASDAVGYLSTLLIRRTAREKRHL